MGIVLTVVINWGKCKYKILGKYARILVYMSEKKFLVSHRKL